MKNLLVITIALFAVSGFALAQESQVEAALPAYPKIRIETTAGNLVIELFTSRAPLTVQNFVQYVESGFYDGTVFHRVVAGFVAQAGGYDADYKRKTPGATIPNESGNGLSNRRGTVAMARTGEPHSADSQFYINLTDNTALDPRPTRWGYTVFGRVIEGMEVIDEIGYRTTGSGPAPELTKDVPKEPIVIRSMALVSPENDAPASDTDATVTAADSDAEADDGTDADADADADAQ
jgi:peptidyl-prolyl cis-trans isomerase A (cyclophilin A)